MYRSLNNQQKKRNRRAPRAQAGGFGDTWCLLAATEGCRGLGACASPASPRPPAAGSAAARSAACQRLGGWASSGAGRGSGRGGGSGSGKRRGFAGCPVATPGGVVRGAHDLCPLVHNRRVLPKDGLRRFCAQRSDSCGAPAAGEGRGGGGGAHLHCRPLLHENVVVRRVVPATPPMHGVSMCRCPGSIVAPGSSPAPAQKRGGGARAAAGAHRTLMSARLYNLHTRCECDKAVAMATPAPKTTRTELIKAQLKMRSSALGSLRPMHADVESLRR